MHICVIGTGYVGLVTGTCFAEFGNNVTCVDIDESKINRLNNGEVPIYEPGLDVLVAKNRKEGRLSFTTDLKTPVEKSLVIFIAVGTPENEDGTADFQHVEAVAKEIANYINGYKVIVNKSTVPVGSTRKVRQIIESKLTHKTSFSIVSNPEFLREGSALEDFMRPNRVVIGADSSEAIAIMKELYSPLYLIETPIVITDPESAELTKYAANAFLATKISFINEIANFCDLCGANVHDVAKAIGLDNRIGTKFLHPGPGYGGSCFPKDTRALLKIGQEHGFNFKIVDSAVEVNEQQRGLMLTRIKNAIGPLAGKTIGILGLAFKPNTDDMREAPSLDIINGLLREDANIKAFDPVSVDRAKALLQNVTFCEDTYEVAEGSDALVFVTEWNQFRSLDLDRIAGLLKSPLIIDLRNIYKPEKMIEKGFRYYSLGRPIESESNN